MQFGIINTCKFFKDYKLYLPYGLVQFCFLWKICSCLLTPNRTRNHVITNTKSIKLKIRASVGCFKSIMKQLIYVSKSVSTCRLCVRMIVCKHGFNILSLYVFLIIFLLKGTASFLLFKFNIKRWIVLKFKRYSMRCFNRWD